MKVTKFQEERIKELFFNKDGKPSAKLKDLIWDISNLSEIRLFKKSGSGQNTTYSVNSHYTTLNIVYHILLSKKYGMIELHISNDSPSNKAKYGDYISLGKFKHRLLDMLQQILGIKEKRIVMNGEL